MANETTKPPARKSSPPYVLYAAFFVFAMVLLLGGVLLIGGAASSLGSGCVGVVDITGPIMIDDSPSSLFEGGSRGSETIASEIEDAGKRSDVKALVLLIDSPGGSVVASKHVYDAVKDFKKPKVAYFREMAASGGYYVGAGADYIVAEPDTITGSIGVRSTMVDLSGLFGKIGYNETTIKSGELKDIGTSTRPMTEKERAILQSIIDEAFAEFRQVVIDGRGSRLDMAKFNEILDARILTGRQAKAIGLVDALGDKKAAVKKAAEMAGTPDLEVCELSGKKKTFLSALLGEFTLFPRNLAAAAPYWRMQY